MRVQKSQNIYLYIICSHNFIFPLYNHHENKHKIPNSWNLIELKKLKIYLHLNVHRGDAFTLDIHKKARLLKKQVQKDSGGRSVQRNATGGGRE